MHPDSPNNKPDLKESTDAALFQALTARDASALATLYDRYANLVYGLALKILRDPQAAEDLTQEVFLALWRHPNYNPARGSLSSFLITLTRSRAIDKLRSRGASLKFLDRWSQQMSSQPPTNNPFEQVSIEERSQKVRSALAQLPENQRQVLAMAYYEGLSQTEIAQRLEAPLGTVKTRARQGLIKLKRILQDWIN
ncbi:sigma-70 family RNA polymerase sigma factor [Cylindrospermum sp. FACHB-282]|uniref:sigma-70 family RNA polymerase sigma factor n=1 Tax=Cylindrospermum sp. FACHB-282 TaxID=2692794 RepID=UPI001683734F|nr:sigma-70 family RNA polymerase sigma factor [Cylindrospermum sp. FACHB-282]MBD2388040.1 sigma-70 family RNA polymerase sigma factor [Cylindrospermum sp. FACHB-282]